MRNIGFRLKINFKRIKWRQGYGFESCKAAISFGFEKLGLDFIVAVIQTPNIASRSLAQKLNLLFWKEFENID